MDKPSDTIRMLRPGASDPDAGRLANQKAGRGPRPYPADDERYSNVALRTAIKYLYSLPPELPIVLDLRQVYPHLGLKWRTIWDLYARGYSLNDIGNWARSVTFRKGYRGKARPDRGNSLVNALIKEVQFYLDLRVEDVRVADLVGVDESGNLQYVR